MTSKQHQPLAECRRRGRRWLQFSLRTLLALMTVACVVFAGAYHYVKPWLVDRAAAKAIAEAGGSCETVAVGADIWRTWFGPDVLRCVTAVDLSCPETTAACLPHLPGLSRLERADIAGARFTDEHLAPIGRLGRLRQLTLRGTRVTAARVAELRAQRPELNLTVQALEISFEKDLRFEEPKGRRLSREDLTERVRCLEGSRVRVRGYMFPTLRQFGNTRFLFIDDNMTNLPPPPSSAIVVETRTGVALDFSVKAFSLEGEFSIRELNDPDTGALRTLYRMRDAVVPLPASLPRARGP